MPCAHRRRVWTGRSGKITHQGASASSCELNDDDCRSSTTRGAPDDGLNNDLNIDRCQEDPAPYTNDAPSATADDHDDDDHYRCLGVSICHLRK